MNIRKIIEEELGNILKEEEDPFARIARLADPDPSPFEKITRAADPASYTSFVDQTPSPKKYRLSDEITPEKIAAAEALGVTVYTKHIIDLLVKMGGNPDSIIKNVKQPDETIKQAAAGLGLNVAEKLFVNELVKLGVKPEKAMDKVMKEREKYPDAPGKTPPTPPAGGSAPAPTATQTAPRARPRPRADVKQLQQLLNKWFASQRNSTDINSLAPTRGDPKGEDGIYGEDTKGGVDMVWREERLPGSRKQYSIQQIINIIKNKLSEPATPTPPSQGPEASPPGEAAQGARGAGAPVPQQESKSLRGMILKEILAALK